MADATKRLLNIMKSTNENTISSLISLTVISVDPLQLSAGEKLILTKDFLVFANYIDTTLISEGDIFRAISLNDNQVYYITEIISSSNELDKYKQ